MNVIKPLLTYGLSILMGLLLSLPCCGFAQEVDGISSVSLQRTRCYGVCPVYTVTIDATGLVTFHGEQFVESVGDFSAIVASDRFERLAAFAQQIGFFGLEDEYRYGTGPDGSRIAVSDLPSRITSVTRGSQTKSVLNYFGGPDDLEAFENLIDEMTDSARWVGQGGRPGF